MNDISKNQTMNSTVNYKIPKLPKKEEEKLKENVDFEDRNPYSADGTSGI